MPAQRIRLALAYKKVAHECVALSRQDDAVFFELGVAHSEVVLCLDSGMVATDPLSILEQLDQWVGGEPILAGVLDSAVWQALLDWRQSVDAILARLCAPVLPAFQDVAENEDVHGAYKAEVERRFGMGVEALSNDRYDGFQQLSRMSRLPELARHLAKNRFYHGGRLSAADLVLACDLFPLQLLDGVSVPLELMYYIQRIEGLCGASLRDGLVLQH
jgi:glutathione S-transferase